MESQYSLFNKNRIPFFHLLIFGFWPSSIKKLFYRMKGYKIGKNVKLGLGSILIAADVSIEKNTEIGLLTVLRASKIRIASHVSIGSLCFMDTETIEIGEDTRIREQVYVGGLRDKDSLLQIGKRCLIMQSTYINPTRPIIMGDDSAIGGHSHLFTHSSWLSALEGYPVKFGPITIGKKVWLAFRVFITSNVTIGDHVIVGPDSLVSENIPAESIAGGNPLKIRPNIFHRDLPPEKRQKIINEILLEFLDYAQHNGAIHEEQTGDTGRLLQLRYQNKTHTILIVAAETIPSLKGQAADLLLLLNAPLHQDVVNFTQAKMIISLKNLKRLGSSSAGEELVRYFSRYGIRFERME